MKRKVIDGLRCPTEQRCPTALCHLDPCSPVGCSPRKFRSQPFHLCPPMSRSPRRRGGEDPLVLLAGFIPPPLPREHPRRADNAAVERARDPQHGQHRGQGYRRLPVLHQHRPQRFPGLVTGASRGHWLTHTQRGGRMCDRGRTTHRLDFGFGGGGGVEGVPPTTTEIRWAGGGDVCGLPPPFHRSQRAPPVAR